MSDDEFYDYAKETGKIAYQYITDNMADMELYFSELTYDEKKAEITHIYNEAKEEAKYIISEKYQSE